MVELICIKKCFWESLIEEGQPIFVKDEADIPPSVRPFFELKEKVEVKKQEEEQSKADELETVRAELDKRNIPFDRRWGLSKLEGVLNLAKRDEK